MNIFDVIISNNFWNMGTGEMGSLVLGALVDELNQRMLTSFDYNSEFIRIGNSDIPKLESSSERYVRKL